ncbi:MAG: hypothetical protein K2G89_09580 [Lachnospiraceae bacterium]|nr:hypothetical protein [Lachnospiraceae bacterium]
MEFRTIGYYIVELTTKPEFIALDCETLLSISPCICDVHPDLGACFWVGHEKTSAKYQSRLGLSGPAFLQLEEEVARLFASRRIDVDGRFTDFEAALHFYRSYIGNVKAAKLVQVRMSVEDAKLLTEEDLWGQNAQLPKEQALHGTPLGGELVGFDGGSFHSYLCNGLEKTIFQSRSRHINACGVLQYTYSELTAFADKIQGQGEPVNWQPCLLYDCPGDLYGWIGQLCKNSGKDTAFLEDFWHRLGESSALLWEMDYFRQHGDFKAETEVAGYTVVDVMVWQIDHFKSHMDRGEYDMRENPDCMVLMAFDTMLRMQASPEPYVQAMQLETGTDYEGKYR